MTTMDALSSELMKTMIDAYPDYVAEKLAIYGLPEDQVGRVIAEGIDRLDQLLRDLLSTPYRRQAHAPLEMFQLALEGPNEELRAAGQLPPTRDPVTQAALPGDVYGLAPASSRELGEAVWQAHLRWGVAKAEAMTGG